MLESNPGSSGRGVVTESLWAWGWWGVGFSTGCWGQRWFQWVTALVMEIQWTPSHRHPVPCPNAAGALCQILHWKVHEAPLLAGGTSLSDSQNWRVTLDTFYRYHRVGKLFPLKIGMWKFIVKDEMGFFFFKRIYIKNGWVTAFSFDSAWLLNHGRFLLSMVLISERRTFMLQKCICIRMRLQHGSWWQFSLRTEHAQTLAWDARSHFCVWGVIWGSSFR